MRSRYRPGVAQRVGGGITVLFHDRGTRRGWVVSSTPRPHFTPGKDPVPILQEAGWTPGSGRAENLVPTGIRSQTVVGCTPLLIIPRHSIRFATEGNKILLQSGQTLNTVFFVMSITYLGVGTRMQLVYVGSWSLMPVHKWGKDLRFSGNSIKLALHWA